MEMAEMAGMDGRVWVLSAVYAKARSKEKNGVTRWNGHVAFHPASFVSVRSEKCAGPEREREKCILFPFLVGKS